MAVRPWVSPQEVKDYSTYDSVASRSYSRLLSDISRAEEYVVAYTNNHFDDMEKYPFLPEKVRTAVILLAEVYAENATGSPKRLKSETFDDYSYTAENSLAEVAAIDLKTLLDEFIVEGTKGGTELRLRKI